MGPSVGPRIHCNQLRQAAYLLAAFLLQPTDSFSSGGTFSRPRIPFTRHSSSSLDEYSPDDPNTSITNGSGSILNEQFQLLRKQKQFKGLPADALQVVSRSSQEAADTKNVDVVAIKTMVLQVNHNKTMETILIILAKDDKLDMQKVDDFWREKYPALESVQLAPSDQLVSLVGYPSGCVPPLGHKVPSSEKDSLFLPTIIDASLIQNTPRRFLLGGGGHEDFQSMVRLAALVAMDHVEIANVSIEKTPENDKEEDDNTSMTNTPSRIISLPAWGSNTRPKPLFPVETPTMDEAQSVLLENTDDDDEDDEGFSNPANSMIWVTFVGEIDSVRRLSKRLVFCDVHPPGYGDPGQETEDAETANTDEDCFTHYKTWRSATDGKDLSVQLIGGATLCQAMGEVQGQAALKQLKPRQLLLIHAKVNVYNSRDSLELWVSQRRLDLVLVSYQVLHSSRVPLSLEGDFSEPEAASTTPNKPYLQWQDLNSSDYVEGGDPQDYITLVDDMESVQAFSVEVSKVLDTLNKSNDYHSHVEEVGKATAPECINGDGQRFADNNETTSVFGFAGIDCEWKPGVYLDNPREMQPILLLQICIHETVYLLDLQSLARPLLATNQSMTSTETLLNDAVAKLFKSRLLFKVGFQLVQDLQRLAVSYPHIPSFQEVHGVLESAELAMKVMRSRQQKNAMFVTSSLSRLTEHFFEKSVNKEQQVSDWSQRPLTKEQSEYAALDAAITPALLEQFFEELELSVFLPGPELGRWKADSFYAKLLNSWRFLLLQPDVDASVVKKLKAKPVLSNQPLLVATQTWNTASEAPITPYLPGGDT